MTKKPLTQAERDALRATRYPSTIKATNGGANPAEHEKLAAAIQAAVAKTEPTIADKAKADLAKHLAANNGRGHASAVSTISPAAAAVGLPKDKPTKVENVGPSESITLAGQTIAAVLMCASKDDPRHYLRGVQLSRAGDKLMRVAATNGHVLMVANVQTDDKLPEWISEKGVIVERDRLAQVLKLAGTKKGDTFDLAYGKNQPHLLADVGGWCSVKISEQDGQFPDLAKVIEGGAAALTHENAVPLEAAGLDPKYVKLAAEVGTALGAANVRAFTASSRAVSVFTFAAAAAALYIMPMSGEAGQLQAETAEVLAPAIRRSMAALKAHQTRLLEAAKDAKPEAAEELRAKAQDFANRIKAFSIASGERALPAPAKTKKVKAAKPKTTAPASKAVH